MPQDQWLQNRLAQNLHTQESLKKEIAEKELMLYNAENEQIEIEQDINDLLGVLDDEQENVQGNEQSFNNILNDIASDMLKGIDVELDKNEQGETIQ